jgi:hypothetical protein
MRGRATRRRSPAPAAALALTCVAPWRAGCTAARCRVSTRAGQRPDWPGRAPPASHPALPWQPALAAPPILLPHPCPPHPTPPPPPPSPQRLPGVPDAADGRQPAARLAPRARHPPLRAAAPADLPQAPQVGARRGGVGWQGLPCRRCPIAARPRPPGPSRHSPSQPRRRRVGRRVAAAAAGAAGGAPEPGHRQAPAHLAGGPGYRAREARGGLGGAQRYSNIQLPVPRCACAGGQASRARCRPPLLFTSPGPPRVHPLPTGRRPCPQERCDKLDRLRCAVDAERRRAAKAFSRAEARIHAAYGTRPGGSYSGGGVGGYGADAFGPEDDFEYDFGPGAGGVGPRGGGEAERVRALEDYERFALHQERRLAGGRAALAGGLRVQEGRGSVGARVRLKEGALAWLLRRRALCLAGTLLTRALSFPPALRPPARSLLQQLPRAGAPGVRAGGGRR